MNILKTLRKPYFSIFYTLLILILSCSSPTNNNEIEENIISVEKFAQEHFELSNSLLALLKNESNINYDLLNSSINEIKALAN
ncbi:hypothetical protein [Ichthyenterobacterium magnum]|uniref:Uncharacterized protein n=1 Tax=Ichthyenterobacterium magnum TaxID=1230530 RepID=A0A420DUY8_9FLAO|nr:hypothetical protein [Ichthyenterobacterium magnum]RKE98082.1 hypothetical protein BXY80_0153 [Ichthyenterobacterium magnum]